MYSGIMSEGIHVQSKLESTGQVTVNNLMFTFSMDTGKNQKVFIVQAFCKFSVQKPKQ